MAGFFCITRISGTSHKIGRNFSQDLPHLVTRYQASRFLASFYVLFCGHIPLPVGNMPLPKNCPKNPSEVSASPQTACSWAFRLKDWLLKFFSRVFILSAGIYVFSAMAVYFPASSEFSPCTCVLFTFRPLGTLKDFFQSERFRGINSSARMPMNKAFAERLKPLKEKISVLLCVYKETGETTGRINKSS